MTQALRKICLIEDDEIMGESLSDRFLLEGLDHDWHRNGTDALVALRHKDYALVICDIHLPDIKGDALFKYVIEQQFHMAPFIFITGHSEIKTAVELLQNGALDYIAKPFDLDALIEKIQNLTITNAASGSGGSEKPWPEVAPVSRTP